MGIRVLAAVLVLVSSSVASAAPDTVLQPVENWGVDAGNTQCTAARSFGSASDPVVLGIVPSLSGNSYQLLVSIQREGPAFAKEAPGTVDFGSAPISSEALYFGRKGVRMSVYQYRISAAQMQQAASAPRVTLQMEHGDSYSFALADMPALFRALQKCTADLQRYWNLDGKTTIKTVEKPVKDIRSFLTTDQYPTEAARLLMQQQRDIARYQLLVDETGAVAGCDVLVTSGVPIVDATACDVIKQKAKFTPAVDSQGKSMRSVWTTNPVGWTAAGNALDGGCTMVSSDSATLLNTCGRTPGDRIQSMPAEQRAPPPPPPSSH
jgi:Gram-negative bacterial TonB protein C-terminal